MAQNISIVPSDLLIDEENPRLPQPNAGQREAVRGIASDQGRKIVVLAKDIVDWGMSPAELPIVMPRGDDLKRYVVLEGNRRIVALKVLENPEMLVGAIDAGELAELRRLSKKYQETPIESVTCTVAKDREEAKHWIKLRHTGQNDGAGVVPWGSEESQRFGARSGNLEIHSQALNLLENRGDITADERRQIPVTSYKRLLETPYVRKKLGIELRQGQLHLIGEEKAVAKALLHVANDLSSGRITVKKIYTRKQRMKYADGLPADVVVEAKVADGEGKASGKTAQSKARAKARLVRSREFLIPRDCVLSVTAERVQDIENELRTLRVDDYTNAVSVLFRVFLELSADSYINDKKLPVSVDKNLASKIEAVANDLVAKLKLNKHQATPVRRFCQRDSFLAPSVELMHKYVHCPNIFPAPGDLRAHWKSLQPFVAALWSP